MGKGLQNKAVISYPRFQPNESFQPYSKIKQLPSKPFATFVEILTQAIELQVKNEGAQEQVLEEMAPADADEQCKAAILSLSTEPAPALHDMLQVCARKIPFIKAYQNHSSRVKLPQKSCCCRHRASCTCAIAIAQERNNVSPVRSGWTLGISMPFEEAISGLSGEWGREFPKVQREIFKETRKRDGQY
ncbi:hypothetical protein DUI87_08152 [Hirundo rustica rustica]|uniref:Retroviral nucleocapsid Gag protein p24 C-terminal domain-containing protein n=1 Tax=Hirundo rustica rustica TaxID=333673 RepID=A0A3M0KRX9_HIRRU|nr:hypothetical protein DUI87_08152 [Hirundo rustica rustica]